MYFYLSSYSKLTLTLNNHLPASYFLEPHQTNAWLRHQIKAYPTNRFKGAKPTTLRVFGEVKGLYMRKNNSCYSYSNVTTALTSGLLPLTLLTLRQVYELGWFVNHLQFVQWTNIRNQMLLYSLLKPYNGKFFVGLTKPTLISNKTSIKNLLINV